MPLLYYLLGLVLLSAVIFANDVDNPYKEPLKCEQLSTTHCSGLPYNFTIFPNHLGHLSQIDAGKEMEQYTPLLKIQCSPSLKLFLCSLLFPPCTIMKKPLDPCKSLCIQNRQGCEPIMRRFSFSWPDSMKCERFPEHDLCIRENKSSVPPPPIPKSSYECPEQLKVNPNLNYSIEIGSHSIHDCGIPCDNYFYTEKSSQTFARIWIGLWSCLCVASTLFTVLTFLIDMDRFQYPERPIIFLSACYLMISITYVVGLVIKDKAACSGSITTSGGILLITQGTKVESCIVLFMMLYFFSMASSIWWIILTVTWYLAAERHWAHEAIAQNSQYFHFAAWAIPAAKTIALLAWGKVDGDPISGVCFTGLMDMWALRGFLILPLCIYLLIGTGFLVTGYVSMFKIRSIVKDGGTRTDKLEKLIMRIGVFSVLYIVPAVIVISCYVFESIKHDEWMHTWYRTKICDKYPTLSSCQDIHDSVGLKDMPKPAFELLMIKYLMSLVVGITSVIWIWSGKTFQSWVKFFERICGRKTSFRKDGIVSHIPRVEHPQQMIHQNIWYPGNNATVQPGPAAIPLLEGRSTSNGPPPSYREITTNGAQHWITTVDGKGVSVL